MRQTDRQTEIEKERKRKGGKEVYHSRAWKISDFEVNEK